MQSMSPAAISLKDREVDFHSGRLWGFLFSFPFISLQLMTSKFYTCVTPGLKNVESMCLWNLTMSSDQTCIHSGRTSIPHRGLIPRLKQEPQKLGKAPNCVDLERITVFLLAPSMARDQIILDNICVSHMHFPHCSPTLHLRLVFSLKCPIIHRI